MDSTGEPADSGRIPTPLDPQPPQHPFPDPRPQPWPFPPGEPWRCRRLGPVSGRYEGEMTQPKAGSRALDLRVDIDPRYANSPVMDRVSGDLYMLMRIGLPFRPGRTLRIYQVSWIVDEPEVSWARCSVTIRGRVRFWTGTQPTTDVTIVIPWATFTAAGPASVTFEKAGGTAEQFTCKRMSDCFRDLDLQVGVCASVDNPPVVPTYDTHAHNTRPAGMPQRDLTIEEAYREAGICVTTHSDRPVVDDSDPQFDTWTDAELHDAMESHFALYPGGWPKWAMWGLLAGRYVNASVGGIMFDYGAQYGGPGRSPERQGFAVFREHSWFDNLPAGTPANQDEAWALRQYLYTWVHEAGHAFNYVHSWNKGRPDALSWMNYPQNVTGFWDDFALRLDDEELIHLRHGNRAAVIPGGDAWATGLHLEGEAPAWIDAQLEGDAPVELLVRSKASFDFMEPVSVELRLRNLLDDTDLPLDTRLDPASGTVAVYIRKPSGNVVEYHAVMCKVGEPEVRALVPTTGVKGEDRFSHEVLLSYGADGFYFDEPGEYAVRAVYRGPGGLVLPSNLHRVRIAHPASRDEESLAQDFFSHQVGMALLLGGSRSPHLEEGHEVLERVCTQRGDTLLGARVAAVLMDGFSRPFFHLDERTLRKIHDPEPERGLALSEPARELYHHRPEKALNLAYHRLVRARARALTVLDEVQRARQELAELRADLADRDVNEPVLAAIAAHAESL